MQVDKIKGDYGSPFKTGSTIIVTLDTGAGTLSFSSWNDNMTSASFSLDQTVQNILSPRRSSQAVGTVEDWGIAFEGLPLDAKLYPAVGLYQRDDRVTLLPIESFTGLPDSGIGHEISGAACYYPLPSVSPGSNTVADFNSKLTLDGIKYAAGALDAISHSLSKQLPVGDVSGTILTSLASSLSLLPSSIPVLSKRTALILLPHVNRAIERISAVTSKVADPATQVFMQPKAGKWTFHAINSSGMESKIETYSINLDVNADQLDDALLLINGLGQLCGEKTTETKIELTGTITGSSMTFLESRSVSKSSESSQISTCAVSGRLGLDGKRFEGVYRNVTSNSTGNIVGVYHDVDAIVSGDLPLSLALLVKAQSHLTEVLEVETVGDFCFIHSSPPLAPESRQRLTAFMTSSALRHASLDEEHYSRAEIVQDLENLYIPRNEEPLFGMEMKNSLDDHSSVMASSQLDTGSKIVDVMVIDSKLTKSCGGKGSLRSFCGDHYDKARLSIISSILHHCLADDDLKGGQLELMESKTKTLLTTIWSRSLQITEDAVRKALSKVNASSRRESCVEACCLLQETSNFLTTLAIDCSLPIEETTIIQDLLDFFGLVEGQYDLAWCAWRLKSSSFSVLTRSLGIQSYVTLLSSLGDKAFEVSEILLSRLTRGCGALIHGEKVPTCLPSTYMDSSHGFYRQIRQSITTLVSQVSVRLFAALRERTKVGTMATDSFVLCASSSLFSLVGTLTSEDFLECGNVLELISQMMPLYLAGSRIYIETSEATLTDTYRQLRERETSRAIVTNIWAITHLIVFEMSEKEESNIIGKKLVDLLQLGLASAFNAHEYSIADESSTEKGFLEDCVDSILRTQNGESPTPHDSGATRTTPFDFFVRSGLSKLAIFQSKHDLGGRFSKVERTSCFPDQITNQWLHILNLALLCPFLSDIISAQYKWCALLLNKACSEPVQVRNVSLPARFRARILRLMYEPVRRQSPRVDVVETLLEVAGRSSLMTCDPSGLDELAVSVEAVSLLRRLYNPCNIRWREVINASLKAMDAAPFSKRVGALCFLSGIMNSLQCGSYVIIKPAVATLFSNDERTSSNVKGQSFPGSSTASMNSQNNGATAHHVVGNGTEFIVSGFSAGSSPGGIVTSIDIKTSLCEVLLLGRTKSSLPSGQRSTRNRTSAYQTLTIRALRKPLSDLVEASEVPLYFGSDVELYEALAVSMLKSSTSALKSLFSDTTDPLWGSIPKKEGTMQRNGAATLLCEVMALRTCVILLSHLPTLQRLLKNKNASKLLQVVLELAWPEVGSNNLLAYTIRCFRGKGMSTLPSVHARYCHLLSLEKLAAFQSVMIKNMSDESTSCIAEILRSKRDAGGTSQKTPDTPLRERSEHDVPKSREIESQRTISQSRAVTEETRRSISQSTGGSNSDEEDEEAQAADREAAIAQMAELGLPRALSELALRRTGGVNIEAAVTFCLERGPEIERLLAEEQEHDGSRSRVRSSRESSQSSRLLQQLLEMGFPRRWCLEALAVTGNNVDEALTWILNNGERLSEEDEAIEAAGADVDEFEDEDDESTNEEDDGDVFDSGKVDDEKVTLTGEHDNNMVAENSWKKAWTGTVTPLRFISGKATIDPAKMEVSGLPSGGFSSVGTKGILLTSGKWYYEAILESAGCLQIGWADGSFSGHCHADRGDGCGDGPSSWAFDGWRRYRWHASSTEWGCRWRQGDVVGCLVDMDDKIVSFTLNGKAEEIGMGVAFSGEGFRPCGGVYACASFNRKEKLKIILGGEYSEAFRYSPPPGYRGVGEAVIEAVDEFRYLVSKESALDLEVITDDSKPSKFLCDFSDAEHGHELMSWAHRYYGSDASVHLGMGRNKQSPQRLTSGNSTTTTCASDHLTQRLETILAEKLKGSSLDLGSDNSTLFDMLLSTLKLSFASLHSKLCSELIFEVLALSILLSRKVILHTIITMGKDFDPHLFLGESNDLPTARKLWLTIEACASLRHAGWVGEAGAMALAAEALGLGISSADHVQHHGGADRRGNATSDGVVLLTCGGYQLLTSLLHPVDHEGFIGTSRLLSACTEATICGNGGSGMLGFLKEGLKRAVLLSRYARELVLAAIRRSVRVLAAIEYDESGDAYEVGSHDILTALMIKQSMYTGTQIK